MLSSYESPNKVFVKRKLTTNLTQNSEATFLNTHHELVMIVYRYNTFLAALSICKSVRQSVRPCIIIITIFRSLLFSVWTKAKFKPMKNVTLSRVWSIQLCSAELYIRLMICLAECPVKRRHFDVQTFDLRRCNKSRLYSPEQDKSNFSNTPTFGMFSAYKRC